MSGDKKPLVLDGGQLSQLQATDDLDIPLQERVAALERKLELLLVFLAAEGLAVPDPGTLKN